jgi:hypothetical protein
MTLMTKEIELKARNIKKARDKKYCFDTYEDILSSLFDFDCVSNLSFDKDIDSFNIRCTLKICKSADILWILIKEWLSTIIETESDVAITITEIENGNNFGISYSFNLFKRE